MKTLIVLAIVCLITTIALSLAEKNKPIPPENLWKILIRESVGEGYRGMYAVCNVFYNRLSKGMSLGATAVKRRDFKRFVNRHKPYHKVAKEIVNEVFYLNRNDITGGAIFYENIEKYGIPKFARNKYGEFDVNRFEITVKIKSHTFWKEK